MAAAVSALRRSVFSLIIAACLAGVSCSDRESPTGPSSSSTGGKATIFGTLLAEPAAAAGGASGSTQPLAGVSVRVASSGQTAQTDAAGNFTLAGLSPGAVSLEIRGAGIQASTTVIAAAAMTTRVTVTVNRGRSTVNVSLRSDGLEGVVDSLNVPGKSLVLKNQRGLFTVLTDGSTRFRLHGAAAGLADLAAGQRVEVEGSLQKDGSILARQVNIEESGEDETRTPRPSPTVTTTPPTATTTPSTATPTRTPRPDDEDDRTKTPTVSATATTTPSTATPTRTPRPDDEDDRTKTPTVSATATTTATTPLPTRTPTSTRTPEAGEAEREGTVTGILSGSSFTLMTGSGSITIQTNGFTQFRNDDNPAAFTDIKVGARVDVRGTIQTDGTLLASRVSIEGSGD
jgi:Domain of unknown function (DUF5666)/Carboxypeptidase regulatory-like domain